MSEKKKILFISYEQAKQICDKKQYNEASIIETIQFSIRLLWCNLTKAYSNRNVQFTKLCNKATINIMDSKKKEALKKKLLEKLK